MVSVLHVNFISCRVSFVLRWFYKINSSCLCCGENSKWFCLAELWPCTAWTDHLDSLRLTLMPSTRTKIQKIILVSQSHASSKVHLCFTEGQTFYWSILTADDSIKWCANSSTTGQVGGFQNPGVCLQAFPSFLAHPLSTLSLAPFFVRPLIDSRSLFFTPKPHRNACYAGYLLSHVTKY